MPSNKKETTNKSRKRRSERLLGSSFVKMKRRKKRE